MHLGRPVIPVGPEGAVIMETDGRTFPGVQVPAGIDVKAVRRSPAGSPAGAVQVILSFVDQHKRIPDVDFLCVNHGKLLDGW